MFWETNVSPFLAGMKEQNFTYSFDKEGVQKIYRNEACMIAPEWKVNQAEAKVRMGATRVLIDGGFDALYVQKPA